MGERATAVLTAAHKIVIVAWIVGVGWMLYLAVRSMGAPSTAAAGFWGNIAGIQDLMNLAAVATLLVGVVYGVWTKWGFGLRREHWILLKWGLAVTVAATGVAVVGAGTRTNLVVLGGATGGPTGAAVLGGFGNPVVACLIAQLVLLVAAVAVSLLKPWRGEDRVI